MSDFFHPLSFKSILRCVVTFTLASATVFAQDNNSADFDSVFQGHSVQTADLVVDEIISDDFGIELASCQRCGKRNPYCGCRKNRWVDLWNGRMEIGLNGAEGNSRNVNLVVGFDAKRVKDLDTITMDVDYLFSSDEVSTTKNRFYSLTRWERDIPNSNWGTFADVWFEYDELESFRSRLGLHAGGVYTWINTDDHIAKGLLGLGTSKEMYGDDQAWRPEAFLGTHLARRFKKRQFAFLKAVLYPDVGGDGDYRLNIRGGWEYAMNEEETLKLSLSAFDRYDSAPSGLDKRNNIDYWASLIWAF